MNFITQPFSKPAVFRLMLWTFLFSLVGYPQVNNGFTPLKESYNLNKNSTTRIKLGPTEGRGLILKLTVQTPNAQTDPVYKNLTVHINGREIHSGGATPHYRYQQIDWDVPASYFIQGKENEIVIKPPNLSPLDASNLVPKIEVVNYKYISPNIPVAFVTIDGEKNFPSNSLAKRLKGFIKVISIVFTGFLICQMILHNLLYGDKPSVVSAGNKFYFLATLLPVSSWVFSISTNYEVIFPYLTLFWLILIALPIFLVVGILFLGAISPKWVATLIPHNSRQNTFITLHQRLALSLYSFFNSHLTNISFSREGFALYLGFTLCLVVAFSPVLHAYYVFHDDYFHFMMIKGNCASHPVFNYLKLECGRPIAAYFVCGLGNLINTVEGANIVRFFNVLFLSFSGFFFYLWLTKNHYQNIHAFLLTAFIFTLPSSQSHVAYLSNGYQILSTILALFAGYFAFSAVNSQKPPSLSLLFCNSIVSVALLFLSLITYPPSAMIYWVAFGAVLIKMDFQTVKPWLKQFTPVLIVGFLTLGLFFIYVRLLPRQTFANSLEPHIWKKIELLFNGPLFDASNLWSIFPSQYFAITVATIIGAGVGLDFYFNSKKSSAPVRIKTISLGIQKYICVIILLFLSVLPGFAAANAGSFPYRTQLALSALIVICVYWSFTKISELLPGRFRNGFLTTLLISASLMGVYQANYNVKNYFSLSGGMELNYTKNTIQQSNLEKYTRIHLIDASGHSFFPSNKPRYDEFGNMTSSYTNDLELIWIVAMRELDFKLEIVHWDSQVGGVQTIKLNKKRYRRPLVNLTDKILLLSKSTKDQVPPFLENTLFVDFSQLNSFTATSASSPQRKVARAELVENNYLNREILFLENLQERKYFGVRPGQYDYKNKECFPPGCTTFFQGNTKEDVMTQIQSNYPFSKEEARKREPVGKFSGSLAEKIRKFREQNLPQ